MDSLGDLLQDKVNKLDLETTKTKLEIIQQELDRMYRGQARAIQIKSDKTVLIGAKSAPLASEIRYQQIELIRVLSSAINEELKGVQIIIR